MLVNTSLCLHNAGAMFTPRGGLAGRSARAAARVARGPRAMGCGRGGSTRGLLRARARRRSAASRHAPRGPAARGGARPPSRQVEVLRELARGIRATTGSTCSLRERPAGSASCARARRWRSGWSARSWWRTSSRDARIPCSTGRPVRGFSLEGAIKSVVTTLAKTHHYWMEHVWIEHVTAASAPRAAL